MTEKVAPLPALSLRQMLYFVTLARNCSFTETAAQLSVTQPALSAAIRQMEKQFGGQLFDRSSHRVVLTDNGAAILPLAEHLLNTARSAFKDMASSFVAGNHSVRIGLVPSSAARVLPALAAVRQGWPALRPEIFDGADVLGAIERGEVDFGVGVTPANSAPFEVHPLWEDNMVVLLPKGDPLAGKPNVAWRELAERDIALFHRGSISERVTATLGTVGLAHAPTYRIEHTEPLYGMVRAGLAVAILTTLYTETLNDPALVVRPLNEPRVARSIALLRSVRAPRSPSVARCFEALRAELKADDQAGSAS